MSPVNFVYNVFTSVTIVSPEATFNCKKKIEKFKCDALKWELCFHFYKIILKSFVCVRLNKHESAWKNTYQVIKTVYVGWGSRDKEGRQVSFITIFAFCIITFTYMLFQFLGATHIPWLVSPFSVSKASNGSVWSLFHIISLWRWQWLNEHIEGCRWLHWAHLNQLKLSSHFKVRWLITLVLSASFIPICHVT